MPMRDWLSRYPHVAALLQRDEDVIEGASVEAPEETLEDAPCVLCAAPPVFPADATAYVQHCIDTGHELRSRDVNLLQPVHTLSGRALWVGPGQTLVASDGTTWYCLRELSR